VEVMFDSDVAADIPASPFAVAGYVDGEPGSWSAADWDRFRDAYTTTISRRADRPADWLDIERGAALPAHVPTWAGKGFYCNLSTLPAVETACRQANKPLPKWWAAHPTGQPHIVPGSVATQWAWPKFGSPGHYDISAITDISLLTPPRSAPVPSPIHPPLNKPIVGGAVHPTVKGYWLVGADGGVFALGDAPYLGGLVGIKLAAPIVSIIATPTGNGYWLIGADGGVFAFGDAPYLGSLAGGTGKP
jgi:hypothetical protein